MTLPRKDHLGAAVLVGLGIAILAIGSRYSMGTLVNMGPAFIPVVLGTLMTLLGLAIGALAKAQTPEEQAEQALPRLPDWRGVACVLGALAVFIAFARFGLVPATFACVFVAAVGDRDNGWRSAFLLALAMVVFGVLVFYYGLSVQLPLFAWGG